MIERKRTEEGEKWVACTHIVYFRDGGKEDSQYTTDVDYWLRFAEKWADTFEVLTIEEVIWSDEQIERLKEIEDMPEGWSERYTEYVRNGTLHIDDMPDTHPFVVFAFKKELARREAEKEELKARTTALGQTLTEEKITNIQKDMLLQGLGQEVATLKIELITLKGGE